MMDFPKLLDGTRTLADVFEIVKRAVERDVGYTRGSYVFRANGPDGKPQISYGKYVTIWRKQADGEWKFVLDIGNHSPPPSGGGPAPGG